MKIDSTIRVLMNRQEQYSRKINFILEKINDLPRDVTSNKYYIDALFYRLQVSIDASMDIVAMLCKDFGITVHDDYSNIQELEKKNLISTKISENLCKLNGLRNVIVHKYNKIEDESDLVETLMDENFNLKMKQDKLLRRIHELEKGGSDPTQ